MATTTLKDLLKFLDREAEDATVSLMSDNDILIVDVKDLRAIIMGAKVEKGPSKAAVKASAEAKGESWAKVDAIYSWFKKRGAKGATCDAMEAAMNLPHQTGSARVHDLEKAGRLVDTGAKGKTRSGRNARVMRAV